MDSEYDIAVVGMSCRLPGAETLDEFWNNLRMGVESIAPLSDDDLKKAGVSERLLRRSDYVKAASVLKNPGLFDAAFFDYSPAEAQSMDPQHRIMLELAWEALEDAACDPEQFSGRISVFTGAALNTYFFQTSLHDKFNESYLPTLIGNDKDFLSTRISYKLNLRGPSVNVQTACSSSLVAIHLARQSLLTNESDVALAGGISVRVPHHAGYLHEAGGVLSADGHVRSFDAKASGTVFGSGGGLVVLKRLADAQEAGDNIYCVIKGSAVNNDGSLKAGYTAPSVDSQAEVIVEALANAGIDANKISYVEAHGSGTALGDPVEFRALTKAFRASTPRCGFCAIGSVKTNLGHLDAAAGVAGFIKTALALTHRELPPSLHYAAPNPEINFSDSPFFVQNSLAPWASAGPRRAGLMSTGIGGTNAHLILEEAPLRERSPQPQEPVLLELSAKTATGLDASAERLRTFLQNHPEANLGDVAYTLQAGRKAFSFRQAVVSNSPEDAINRIGRAEPKTPIRAPRDPALPTSLVFLLPGMGDQYVGMGHELYRQWGDFRATVDQCAELLHPELGRDLRQIIHPAALPSNLRRSGIDLRAMLQSRVAPETSGQADPLQRTLFAQTALFTIEYALARLWWSWGIRPAAMVGHSLGEYVAACLAGVFSLEDALRLIVERAKLVESLPVGRMLAVTMAEEKLRPRLGKELSLALINGPQLCVVAGPIAAVNVLERQLEADGVTCRSVQNTHAFHSRLLDPIVPAFEKFVSGVKLNPPTVPLISNLTGRWLRSEEAVDPGYWARHTTHTARFHQALTTAWSLGNPLWLEVGPGRTLGTLALQHPSKRRQELPIASMRPQYEHCDDREYIWRAAGQLWVNGMNLDWDAIHKAEKRARVPLPAYPFEREEFWLPPVSAAAAGKTATVALEKNADWRQWFYVPSWKRLPGKDASTGTLPQRWLVFADNTGLSAELAHVLRQRQRDVVVVEAGPRFNASTSSVVINPNCSEDYHKLVQSLHDRQLLPECVVHAWSFAAVPENPHESNFVDEQTKGFYSLAHLTRALARHNLALHLLVLSHGIQDVHGTEPLEPSRSTLLAPCLVIPQEHPNVRTKSIDLDVPTSAICRRQTVDLLLGELSDWDSENIVAYRAGQRWVQTFEPVTLPEASRPIFRKGGVYLITGGLGNVGFEMAKYLAQEYSAKLLLVGRTPLPDDSTKTISSGTAEDGRSSSARALGRMAELEAIGGQPYYVPADVSCFEQMQVAVNLAVRRFGNLNGVIHAAGIVGPDAMSELTALDTAHCEPHFCAKAGGLTVLARVLHNQTLDFCTVTSSLTPILGGIGEAAYAAGNLFADAFVRSHNRRHPDRPWLSVNWDLWRLEGSPASGALSGMSLQALGITSSEGRQVLPAALASRVGPQLIVSTGDLHARVRQWVKRDLRQEAAAPNRPVARIFSPSVAQAPAKQLDDTERAVAAVWEQALGVFGLGPEAHFGELGGHSLLAIKIVAELRERFQLDMPIRVLFDCPTIALLANEIRTRVLAEVEGLSDEEAMQLVAESPV